MKSVAFLRNTWKKWEHKTLDGRDNAGTTSPATSSRATHSKSRAPNNSRSLTVTVQHVPLEITTTVETVDGSWQPSHGYQPPSPIYEQFTQQRGGRAVSFSHPDSSRISLDVSYPAQNSRPSRSAGSSPMPPTPTSSNLSSSTNSPRALAFSHGGLATPPESPKRAPPQRLPPPSPSPHTPSLPSYQLLPPIELNYGSGTRFESTLDLKICQCSRSGPHSRHQSHCPRYSTGAPKSADSPNSQSSQKTAHAVLDLSVQSKPRSLYHLTKSTPHLPMKDRHLSPTASSVHSASSTEGSETDFPLSLFPAPPPLIIRKRIPAPLVLRPAGPNQSQCSSPETTPVGTPTTPRFPSINSPPQSANVMPRKTTILRSSASFSPPPSSPPNSPLPRVPPYFPREGGTRRCSESHPASPRSAPAAASAHALRVAQSTANLRDALPFPATHRLTSSEPSSDQVSSSPIKRPLRSPAKPRPKAVRASNELRIYSISDMKEYPLTEASPTSDIHIQWGYAL